MNTVRHVNAIEYAYSKIILESSNSQPHYVITEGIFSKVVGWGKKACSAVGNVVKKVGKAIGGWFVGLWNLIKYGSKMLVNFVDGTYKKDQEKLNNDHTELTKSFLVVLPFLSCMVKIPEKIGNQVHEKEFADLKNKMKGKKDGDVDNAAKELGNKTWGLMKSNLTSALGGAKDKAKEFSEEKHLDKVEDKIEAADNKDNKDNKQADNKEENKSDNKEENTEKQENADNNSDNSDNSENKEVTSEDILLEAVSPDEFTPYEKSVLLEFTQKYTHDIHEFIIDNTFKGLTPKVIMEALDHESSVTPQKPIIVENCKLEFKTINGNLICEDTNLKTNDKIIYESGVPFKGKHLIFEETEAKFKRFNHIITESEQEDYNKIITEAIDMFTIITWVGIAGAVVGLVFALKMIITAALNVIPGLGIGASGATAPCDAATGTVTGKAVAVGKIYSGTKSAISSSKQLVSSVKNAKDGGASALAAEMEKEPTVDVNGGPSGSDFTQDIDFNM